MRNSDLRSDAYFRKKSVQLLPVFTDAFTGLIEPFRLSYHSTCGTIVMSPQRKRVYSNRGPVELLRYPFLRLFWRRTDTPMPRNMIPTAIKTITAIGFILNSPC